MNIQTDVEFTHLERAHLASIYPQDGFRVVEKILEVVYEKFKGNLLNIDQGDTAKVLAGHALAKAAREYFVTVTKRVQYEVEMYRQSPKADDAPVDMTDGNEDFGVDTLDVSPEELADYLGGVNV